MTDIELLGDLLPGSKNSGPGYVVGVGIVTNNQDPEGLGRVKVNLPWLSDTGESAWARIATPMAGPERGIYFLPEVDDEVLVVFEHGRIDRPFVIGALWNGTDKPPAKNDDNKNNLRVIKSRSGHTVTLDDTDGEEKIMIADRTGKNTLVLDSKENTITITSDKDFAVKAKGNITMETDGECSVKCKAFSIDAKESFTIKAAQSGTIEASSLAVKGSGGVKVNDGALEVM